MQAPTYQGSPRIGVPRIEDVMGVLKSESYRQLRHFSKGYCRESMKYLGAYRWVKDALSQWSRIYEYPYCLENIRDSLPPNSRVLDAGSGVTLFPFFLSQYYTVTCMDRDDYSREFRAIDAEMGFDVKFRQSDLCELSAPSGSYDGVICISVLEHAKGVTTILREFNRVLRPGGLLVATFDVAIDGNREGIDPEASGRLLAVIAEMFELSYSAADFRSDLADPALYTTRYVRHWDERLLPWPKYTVFRDVKDFLRGRKGRTRAGANINMTFCNITARKRNPI